MPKLKLRKRLHMALGHTVVKTIRSDGGGTRVVYLCTCEAEWVRR